MAFERIFNHFCEQTCRNLPISSERVFIAQKLRNTYAELKTNGKERALSADERSIYVVTRILGTLAALNHVLKRFSQVTPFLPKSALDCGSGPGTALFALSEHFGNNLDVIAIEKDAGFIDMAKNAIETLLPANMEHIKWHHGTIPLSDFTGQVELAIISYMLSETPDDKLESVVEWIIQHTEHYLIITDAGTPKIYQRLMLVREMLIKRQWNILAPCPHKQTCPISANNFCHFFSRFERHDEAKRLKHGSARMEDEKYTYLIAAAPQHAGVVAQENRIIKKPIKRSGHIIFDLCTKDGDEKRVVLSKKHGATYKAAKTLDWGDAF